MRGLILGWGAGAGVAVALVDILTRELIRIVQNPDLATALDVMDLYATWALFGWAAYQVAGTFRELRAGLEAAVAGGLVTGALAVAYYLVRQPETVTAADAVQRLAINVLWAAGAGVAGAWLGTRRRPGGSSG